MKSIQRSLVSGGFSRFAFGFSLAAVLSVGSCALAGPRNDRSCKVDTQLKAALHKELDDYLSEHGSLEHISTLSMDISFRGSKESISCAVGTTEYGGGEMVTPDNLFQIGSDTKAFTSVIILQLEADGVLSIHDQLGKWLPQYPQWKDVTIERLLNMTSGIPTYDLTPAWYVDYGDNPYRKFTPEELVAYVYPNIKTDPGFEYSNTGYILAQMIIDKVSTSHSYKAEVERLIADNHLHDTYFEPDFYPSFVNDRLVSGYFVNTSDKPLYKLLNTETKNYSLGWGQAAGGIISNPRDQSHFLRELFEGDTLPAPQKAELESLVSTTTGKPTTAPTEKDALAFGLGVFQVYGQPLGHFWFYQGSTIGYRADYAFLIDSGALITVFTNSQTAEGVGKVDTILMAKLYETLKQYGKI